jgi:hypothetical protein
MHTHIHTHNAGKNVALIEAHHATLQKQQQHEQSDSPSLKEGSLVPDGWVAETHTETNKLSPSLMQYLKDSFDEVKNNV